MTSKDAIRNLMRTQRDALTPLRIRQASARIQRTVMKLPEWAAARQVCIYLALPTEAQTWALLTACWKTGKQVWVPAYRKRRGAMTWPGFGRTIPCKLAIGPCRSPPARVGQYPMG